MNKVEGVARTALDRVPHVSDLGAGLAGGLGVAPGANIDRHQAVLEVVYGTASDIAGKDRAKPMAAIQSALLTLN